MADADPIAASALPDEPRSIGKSVSWLLSDAFLGLVISAVAGFITAGLLGPEQFGILAYASAAVALVLPVTSALHPLLIRDFSVTKSESTGLLVAPLVVTSVLSACGFVVVLGFALVRVDSPEAARTTLIAGLTLLTAPLLVGSALLIARDRARWVSVTQIAGNGFGAAGRIALALAIGTAVAVQTLATLVSSVVALVIFALSGGFRGRWSGARDTLASVRSLLSEGWPFIVSGIAVAMYMSSDQLMLGLLSTDTETGQYGLAVRIVSVAFVAPMVIMTAVSPAIARARYPEPARYAAYLQRLASYLVLIALMGSIAIAALGYLLVIGVLGPEFRDAYGLALLLLPGSLFVSLGVAQSPWIVNEGHQRFGMVRTLLGAGLNLVLNLALIPTMGAAGAGVATVVAYFVSAVLLNAAYSPARGYLRVQLRTFNLRLTYRMAAADWKKFRSA